jgi:hypothetical protein
MMQDDAHTHELICNVRTYVLVGPSAMATSALPQDATSAPVAASKTSTGAIDVLPRCVTNTCPVRLMPTAACVRACVRDDAGVSVCVVHVCVAGAQRHIKAMYPWELRAKTALQMTAAHDARQL